jgi:hypothetical protein
MAARKAEVHQFKMITNRKISRFLAKLKDIANLQELI